jgi:uncharacterized protein (TIGR02266 family)
LLEKKLNGYSKNSLIFLWIQYNNNHEEYAEKNSCPTLLYFNFRSSKMGSVNRRIGTRIPANFKVDYIHKGDYIISFNKNISVDGMYICTETPPPAGTHLELIFSIGELQEVEVPAIVVWVNAAGPSKEKGMGVQFLTPPSTQLKENIVQVVNRVAVLEKNTKTLT